MLIAALLASALAVLPATRPRDCTNCGAYAGPSLARVTDPYLRQIDIWPEFYSSTCRFEVARSSFVTLGRAACEAETTYRQSAMIPRARS